MEQFIRDFVLQRAPDAHKYHFGHVLVVGGAPGMVGAPYLAAWAALRAGAGLVTVASDEAVIDKLEARAMEIMTLRLPKSNSGSVKTLLDFIVERKVSVLVVGPGLAAGRTDMVQPLLDRISIPVVVDGGALTAVAHDVAALKSVDDAVLTPHDGELKRLFGKNASENAFKDAQQRRDAASSFAAQYGVTLALKGHPTLVFASDGDNLYQNPTGGPALATAGSGDVLAGIIGGMLGQLKDKASMRDIVAAAIQLHGLAGDIAAESNTVAGVIASDVIDRIPEALRRIQSQ